MWHGLALSTRSTYKSAVSQWERYAANYSIAAWPVTTALLEQWIVDRTVVSSDRVQATTMESYLQALRSHHIDMRLSTTVFDTAVIKRLLRGAKSLYPSLRRERRPILPPMLAQLLQQGNLSKDDYNNNAALTLAFAAFLRLGEITYRRKENLTSGTFMGITRADVCISATHDHLVLRLKRSKTDYEHQGVNIIVAASGLPTCAVSHMRALFRAHPAPLTAPLFILSTGGFPRQRLVDLIKSRLSSSGEDPSKFAGHSIRRGAAQHAANTGLTDSEIKILGRWSSDAFKLYFTIPETTLFRLNHRFQTGQTLPLSTPLTP
jgi:hypothetical protein